MCGVQLSISRAPLRAEFEMTCKHATRLRERTHSKFSKLQKDEYDERGLTHLSKNAPFKQCG
jgi:hypothetical protein